MSYRVARSFDSANLFLFKLQDFSFYFCCFDFLLFLASETDYSSVLRTFIISRFLRLCYTAQCASLSNSFRHDSRSLTRVFSWLMSNCVHLWMYCQAKEDNLSIHRIRCLPLHRLSGDLLSRHILLNPNSVCFVCPDSLPDITYT